MAGEKEERPTPEEIDESFEGFDESIVGALSDDAGDAGGDDAGQEGGEAPASADTPVDDKPAEIEAKEDESNELDAFAPALGDDRKRDPATGKFVAKDAAASGAKPAEGETKPAGETKRAAPQWTPFEVTADKQPVKIEEAIISKHDGHVFLAIPEARFERFTSRIAKGVVGERVARQLQQERREFEAQKAAPPKKSDTEIEAELTLEKVKPYLDQILDANDVRELELNVREAKAQRDKDYTAAETERMAKAAEEPWEEEQVSLLADQVYVVLKHPDLAGIDMNVVEDIYKTEMLPIRNALIYKEGDGKFANQEWIYNRLKRAVGSTAASTAPVKPAPSVGASSGNADTSSTTAIKKPTDKADRFNAGVDAGAKPRTTNVKAGRDAARPPARATRDERESPRRQLTPAMAAEDRVRKSTQDWLASDSLDFVGDDD